jgi:phi13 family phage major tail protein
MPSIRVGLDNLYYALLLTDASGTQTTYDMPVHIVNAVSADVQPKSNMGVFYADDGAAETATAIGEITVDFEVNSLPSSVVAALLGATIGADGTVLQKSTDNAPYVALGFRSLKANGKYRYKWLYKGKFQWVQEAYKTEAGTPSGQTEKISGTFIRRDYDNSMQITADEDDETFTSGATWFNAVQEQDADTTPLTVTVNPVDGATAVADNANVVWTFNKAVQPQLVDGSNFFVIDNTGAQKAGTLSISTDQTTVTFTPTAAFAATTAYTAIATTNVKDASGNALAANSITNFTTA